MYKEKREETSVILCYDLCPTCLLFLWSTHFFLSCLGSLRSDIGSSPILANGTVEVAGSIWQRGLGGESKSLASLGCDWMTATFIKL